MNLRLQSFSLMVLLLGSVSSCKTLEDIDLAQEQQLVRLTKGACFGRCPIYECTVYTSGIATFEGQRNTPKLGLWIKRLPDAQMAELKNQLTETNLWQYESFFRSRIADAPLIKIEQFEDGASKMVAGKENRPEPVLQLQDMLEQIAESNTNTWTVRKPFDYNLPKGAKPGEIYVQLAPNIYVRNWIQGYARQGLRVAESLEDRSNYFLLQFDPTIAFPSEMERFFAYDDAVIYSSFLPEKN